MARKEAFFSGPQMNLTLELMRRVMGSMVRQIKEQGGSFSFGAEYLWTIWYSQENRLVTMQGRAFRGLAGGVLGDVQ
eukprot:5038662-Ditylum_brightwellii.AAC.1